MPGLTEPSQWLERYGDLLFRYALVRVGDRPAAEDLVQQTFLAALESRDSFSGRSSESTWLVGILKHKISDHFKMRSREAPLPEGNEPDSRGGDPFDSRGRWTTGPREWGEDPADLLSRKKFFECLAKCLSKLPAAQASAFALREIDGAQAGEICKILEVTETNLWVILHRARMRLRQCLEAYLSGRNRKEEP